MKYQVERSIDDLRRLSVPKVARQSHGWPNGAELTIISRMGKLMLGPKSWPANDIPVHVHHGTDTGSNGCYYEKIAVDSLGRITIPHIIMEMHKLSPHDKFTFTTADGMLVLEKAPQKEKAPGKPIAYQVIGLT